MRLARLLLLLAPLAGCSSGPEPDPLAAAERRQSPLRAQLTFFIEGESARIENFSASVVARAEEPEVRRAAQLWKMTIIPELRKSLLRADDQAVLLHLWAANAQLQHYFTEGQGAVVLGEHAQEGLELFRELSGRVESLAERELGPERFAAARTLVEKYTKGHPLEVDPLQAAAKDPELDELLRDSLGKPLDVVMEPLRAINPGKSLDETAQAVREFGIVVDDMRREVVRMPEQVRWQTELLMLDLDESRTRAAAQASLTALSESAQDISRTAQALPADIEQRVSRLLEELEARQGELRTTLDSVRGTLEDGTATAHALTETAQAIDAALVTFAALTADMKGPPRPADEPAPPPGRPFDITEYTRTAEALTASLVELNLALERVRELSSPESSAHLTGLVDTSVAAAGRRLFLYGAGLIALAAVAYGAARRWSAR
jgi:hypothetical protein